MSKAINYFLMNTFDGDGRVLVSKKWPKQIINTYAPMSSKDTDYLNNCVKIGVHGDEVTILRAEQWRRCWRREE
jgi:hypothetical protein